LAVLSPLANTGAVTGIGSEKISVALLGMGNAFLIMENFNFVQDVDLPTL
jgi:hypothetical protein